MIFQIDSNQFITTLHKNGNFTLEKFSGDDLPDLVIGDELYDSRLPSFNYITELVDCWNRIKARNYSISYTSI